MLNDFLIEAAAATLLKVLVKEKFKPKVRLIALRVFRVLRLTYAGDPDFQ